MKKVCLEHKTSHKLLITPRLRQALRLLEMPFAEFQKYLSGQVEENPLLQAASGQVLLGKIHQLMGNLKDTPLGRHLQPSGDEQKEITASQGLSFQEYLLHQLAMAGLDDEEAAIASELINYIDNNGYLRLNLEQFCKDRAYPLNKAQNALCAIQELEPSGVGARDLRECLLIQLKNNQEEQSLAYRIAYSCFKELGGKKAAAISKKLGVSIDEAGRALRRIASLAPKPAGSFYRQEAPAVIPDITVEAGRKGMRILTKDRDLPKLRINARYKRLLAGADTPEDIKNFIKERLSSALWLINAAQVRRSNVPKVFKAISIAQKKALCKGLSFIKPLTLKDISKKTGLHTSTVGRIVANKFVAAPCGTIKAKDLFSSKLSMDKGGDISAKSVRARIKDMLLGANRQLLKDPPFFLKVDLSLFLELNRRRGFSLHCCRSLIDGFFLLRRPLSHCPCPIGKNHNYRQNKQHFRHFTHLSSLFKIGARLDPCAFLLCF